LAHPPVNDLAKQPSNLLTSGETDKLVASRKLKPSLRPEQQEEVPEEKRLRPVKNGKSKPLRRRT
jgi:hypothetical protein